jgi:hypothetical protein
MGLFDKIKDNAKNISIRALEESQDDDLIVAPESMPAQTEVVSPLEPVVEALQEATVLDQQPSELSEEQFAESADNKEDEAETPKDMSRKSKITEVPKETVQVKREASKSKEPPARPTPAKSSSTNYQPHYKMDKQSEESKQSRTGISIGAPKAKVLDVTPHKPAEPARQAIFARERATMAVLASQRRMNGEVPLYTTTHLRFKTRVFINRIEYSGSFGKNVLPIENVAWVKLRSGGTGVIIETTEGKRVVMVVKPADRLEFADAILKVQALQPKREKFKDTKTVRLDQLDQLGEGMDDLEKLAKLYDKGILTQDEFEAKKKQILGI